MLVVGFAFATVSIPAIAQTISSSIADGGSVKTHLLGSSNINEGSSLHRSWITINDTDCPVKIEDTGIKTSYQFKEYWFDGVGSLTSSVPITAFEIRFVLYDIFGSHIKTLSATEVTDIVATEEFDFSDWGWRAYSNEISELLTSVAFVSHVRTADGEVWKYDENAIAGELLKIQIQTTTEDLESLGEDG